MSDGVTAAGLMTRNRIAWASSIVVLTGIGWTEGAFIGPRSHLLLLPLLAAGVAFITVGHYVRHRWGGWALAVACVSAIALCTLLSPRIFLYALDVWVVADNLALGRLFAVSTCTWALAPVAILLHRLARRPRPLLEWNMPIGLIVFALGQVAGIALVLAYLIVTTPRIG